MNITERIKGILLRPKEEWQTIAGETTSIAELYKPRLRIRMSFLLRSHKNRYNNMQYQ